MSKEYALRVLEEANDLMYRQQNTMKNFIFIFTMLLASSITFAQDNKGKSTIVTEICGVKFGSSYNDAKTKLENILGKENLKKSKPNENFYFFNAKIDDITYHLAYFFFQSDGKNTYMNRCHLINYEKTIESARAKRDEIAKKLAEKYELKSKQNVHLWETYYFVPSDPDNGGLYLELKIVKADEDMAKAGFNYEVNVSYSLIDYVKNKSK